MIRVLLADNNVALCETITDFLSTTEDIEVIGCAYDGEEALDKIQSDSPDVLVLDITMPRLDGLGVLERMLSLKLTKRPKVIMLTAFGREDIIRRFTEFGADYFIVKPFDLNVLAERIRQFADSNPSREIRDENVFRAVASSSSSASNSAAAVGAIDAESHITELLHKMGIPAHFKGYNYLREAVLMVVKEDSLLGGSLTKCLYPKLAEKYSTTPGGVEAAIRNAIISAWDHGNREFVESLLGKSNKDRFPTNSAVIAKLTERIRFNSAS